MVDPEAEFTHGRTTFSARCEEEPDTSAKRKDADTATPFAEEVGTQINVEAYQT